MVTECSCSVLFCCLFRWGVPQGADAEVALRTCLGEIERCYSDNGLPFFLNMQSERVGWLPLPSQVPQSIRRVSSIHVLICLHSVNRQKHYNLEQNEKTLLPTRFLKNKKQQLTSCSDIRGEPFRCCAPN